MGLVESTAGISKDSGICRGVGEDWDGLVRLAGSEGGKMGS